MAPPLAFSLLGIGLLKDSSTRAWGFQLLLRKAPTVLVRGTWDVLVAGIQILRGTRLAHPLPLSLPYEYSIMREKCTLLVSYLGSIVLPLAHFSV